MSQTYEQLQELRNTHVKNIAHLLDALAEKENLSGEDFSWAMTEVAKPEYDLDLPYLLQPILRKLRTPMKTYKAADEEFRLWKSTASGLTDRPWDQEVKREALLLLAAELRDSVK